MANKISFLGEDVPLFTDDLRCDKCGMNNNSTPFKVGYRAVSYCDRPKEEALLVTCPRCEYDWWMGIKSTEAPHD